MANFHFTLGGLVLNLDLVSLVRITSRGTDGPDTPIALIRTAGSDRDVQLTGEDVPLLCEALRRNSGASPESYESYVRGIR